NHLTEWAKHTTNDADVLRGSRLLVDLDPVRPAGISATDEEHALAIEQAHAVRGWLTERGWPAPIYADSGNGAHLIYGLDLPNDPGSHDLVQGCLDALAVVFADERVTVDRQMFNASRISKLYGTLAAKGADTLERPHRIARILDAPERLEVVS